MSKFMIVMLSSFLASPFVNQGWGSDPVTSNSDQKRVVVQNYNLGESNPPFALSGFRDPEGPQIWTNQPQATMEINTNIFGGKRIKKVIFYNVTALAGDDPQSQTLNVYLNEDHVIADRKFTSLGQAENLEIKFPKKAAKEIMTISFKLAEPLRNASDFGFPDSSELGIALRTMDVFLRENPPIAQASNHDVAREARDRLAREAANAISSAAEKTKKEVKRAGKKLGL